MTDEEKAEEYAEHEQCANCINPQYCQGKDECYDFANVKSHFLAGLEAGKDMAETDLATIAYMQGAEQYKLKWHDLRKDPNDLPNGYKVVLNQAGMPTNYDPNRGFLGLDGVGVIAWCEIPKYIEEAKENGN